MLLLAPHRFLHFLPAVCTRSLRSFTYDHPSSKSLASLPLTTSQIATNSDGFNSPDPSRYCQNLGIKDTVRILQNWLATLDVDQHYPSLPEAGNLAALVSQYVNMRYIFC